MKKLTCQNCKQKCCEGYLMNRITGKRKIILPKKMTKICADGIQLIRVSRIKWKCRFLKRGKCSIYETRPWLCKYWFCRDCPKKIMAAYKSYQQNSVLTLEVITKGRVKNA